MKEETNDVGKARDEDKIDKFPELEAEDVVGCADSESEGGGREWSSVGKTVSETETETEEDEGGEQEKL